VIEKLHVIRDVAGAGLIVDVGRTILRETFIREVVATSGSRRGTLDLSLQHIYQIVLNRIEAVLSVHIWKVTVYLDFVTTKSTRCFFNASTMPLNSSLRSGPGKKNQLRHRHSSITAHTCSMEMVPRIAYRKEIISKGGGHRN
jgi:hypothetical protein